MGSPRSVYRARGEAAKREAATPQLAKSKLSGAIAFMTRGGVPEWLKGRAWRARIRETVS